MLRFGPVLTFPLCHQTESGCGRHVSLEVFHIPGVASSFANVSQPQLFTLMLMLSTARTAVLLIVMKKVLAEGPYLKGEALLAASSYLPVGQKLDDETDH